MRAPSRSLPSYCSGDADARAQEDSFGTHLPRIPLPSTWVNELSFPYRPRLISRSVKVCYGRTTLGCHLLGRGTRWGNPLEEAESKEGGRPFLNACYFRERAFHELRRRKSELHTSRGSKRKFRIFGPSRAFDTPLSMPLKNPRFLCRSRPW